MSYQEVETDVHQILNFFYFQKSSTSSLLLECPMDSEQFTNSIQIIYLWGTSIILIQDIFLTTFNSTGECEVWILTLSFKIVLTFLKKDYSIF